MRGQDLRGVPVSCNRSEVQRQYEMALEAAVGFSGDPIALIESALQSQPDFVMGHALKAGLMCIGTDKSAMPSIKASLETAASHWDSANERERAHIAALRAWSDGHFERAVAVWGRILVLWPRDLLALFLAHQGDFLLGQSHWLRDRVAQVLPDWHDDEPGHGFVLGMHAFGLEETGNYTRAEQVGERAVEINPRDAWAVHAVTHVMEMQGWLQDGIDWLTRRIDDWAPGNSLAYHNYWHLALFHMEQGDISRVLELYDRCIRPSASTVVMEMVDATALLWRLRLRGHGVGNRWDALAAAWESLIDDAHYVFNDVHAMMAFGATENDACAKRLVGVLERRARGTDTNAMMTREVGLPVCRALHAFSSAHYTTAVNLLLGVRPVAHRFGGSHAQRDVLNLTLLEAALRDRQYALARALAAERVDLKPAVPFNWMVRSKAEGLMGQASHSDVSRAKAHRLQVAVAH